MPCRDSYFVADALVRIYASFCKFVGGNVDEMEEKLAHYHVRTEMIRAYRDIEGPSCKCMPPIGRLGLESIGELTVLDMVGGGATVGAVMVTNLVSLVSDKISKKDVLSSGILDWRWVWVMATAHRAKLGHQQQ